MPVHIDDIIPIDVLKTALFDRHVSPRSHPELALNVLNYGKTVAWENAWNEATLNCRGLVVDEAGWVVARPFRKFFNYGQDGAPEIPLGDYVEVTDKADGSLGILVPTEDGYIIATRGSFTSEQAIWATKKWKQTYDRKFIPNPDWTYLFEIVYPENRIVLDYVGMEDLILIGAVETATGHSLSLAQAAQGWPGPVVRTLPHTSLGEALSAPPRPNAEGLVVWHPATDSRVKIKQEDYLRLHKMFTGTTKRGVWEVLAKGEDPLVVFADAPDEFHQWLREVSDELQAQAQNLRDKVVLAYIMTVLKMPDGWTRKDFAMAAKGHPLIKFLFIMLDGKDIEPLIWGSIKPQHELVSLRTVCDDAA